MRFQMGTDTAFDTLGQPYEPMVQVGSEGFTGRCIEGTAVWQMFWQKLSERLESERATAVEWRVSPFEEVNADGVITVRTRFSILERADG